jgi:hypothetical protein
MMQALMKALAPVLVAPAALSAPHSAASVIALDDAWLQAEIRGDGDYLEKVLMSGYRSIGADGKVTSKAEIVDHARARGNSPDMAARVAKWKVEHPTRAAVTITGDTAILTWISSKPGASAAVSSCDIFVYTDGHWRALYSQRSAAAT